MRDGGRLAAAIGVLTDLEARHKPAKLALRDWGASARYAGAKDRAFVAGLVLDSLRRPRSLAWRMGEESWRSVALGAARFSWSWSVERLAAAAAEAHGPGALTTAEIGRLGDPASVGGAPPPVRGDYPDWLEPHMTRAFGEGRAEEGAALAERAPLDLRVNTLKADPSRVVKALAVFAPEPLREPPTSLRIAAPAAAERAAAVEATPAFAKGWFEIQDLGSQIAAAAAGEIAGRQVLDYCAGGGGKTLALAAMMGNTGQLYAFDYEARRLTDTVRRAQRAGVRNLQVRSPTDPNALAGLEGRMDLVFVDAPCTGSGVWRRHPDAKWRLTADQLARRIVEQDAVLGAAATFVRPGGRLIYVTCSVFAEENDDRVAALLAVHPDFAEAGPPRRLTLRDTCDGFFIAPLWRGR